MLSVTVSMCVCVEEPAPEDETTVKDDADGDNNDDNDAKDESTDAAPAVVEVTSEQPRSLGTEIRFLRYRKKLTQPSPTL